LVEMAECALPALCPHCKNVHATGRTADPGPAQTLIYFHRPSY
jgi:hypothetical protein